MLTEKQNKIIKNQAGPGGTYLWFQQIQQWIPKVRNDAKAPKTREGPRLAQVKLAGDLISLSETLSETQSESKRTGSPAHVVEHVTTELQALKSTLRTEKNFRL
jgi:hypothetical protein